MVKSQTRVGGNLQVTKAHSKRVITSEAVRPLTTPTELAWNQWLAGLIDGDGCLLISKQGYTSCEITMGIRDEHALNQIKQKLGGSLKLRSGSNSIRYRLHHKEGIMNLISRINGHIRHSTRKIQLQKLCEHFEIHYVQPDALSTDSAWFAGFFDADGTVTFSFKGKGQHPQLSIRVTNKNKADVTLFEEAFGGCCYYDKSQNGYYTWSVQSQSDILKLLEYFKKSPSRSSKKARLHSIPRYFHLVEMRAYAQPENSLQFKAWNRFLDKCKWRSYSG